MLYPNSHHGVCVYWVIMLLAISLFPAYHAPNFHRFIVILQAMKAGCMCDHLGKRLIVLSLDIGVGHHHLSPASSGILTFDCSKGRCQPALDMAYWKLTDSRIVGHVYFFALHHVSHSTSITGWGNFSDDSILQRPPQCGEDTPQGRGYRQHR